MIAAAEMVAEGNGLFITTNVKGFTIRLVLVSQSIYLFSRDADADSSCQKLNA
jgi:hypothetical protein